MNFVHRLVHALGFIGSSVMLTASGVVTDFPISLSQHKYYFENAVFDDGGRIEGWFIYDADAGIIVNSHIITTAATSPSYYEGFDFETGGIALIPEFANDSDYSTPGTVFNPHLIQIGVGTSYINLSLVDSLADTGDRIDFVTGVDLSGSYEVVEVLLFPFWGGGLYPSLYSQSRDIVSGYLTTQLSAVPEPSTYATFAGLAVLGFTVRRRRRV